MSDSFHAIYEAVRSRIGGCDAGSVIECVVREAFDFSWQKSRLDQNFDIEHYERTRPSVLFRPSISMDGNKWCALYGDNIQDGVAGFGDSPSEAMQDFDKAWNTKIGDAW